MVVLSRDNDNGSVVTHTMSDSVDGTTGWNTAGCVVGNLHIADCTFWKIATTNTALTYTINYTPTGVVGSAELVVQTFPNAPAASPLDCWSGTTFATTANQTTGNCVATYTDDTFFSTIACASGSASEFTPVAPFALLFNSPSSTSWRGADHAFSAAGTYTASWTAAGGCVSMGTFPGTKVIVGFKAADGAPVTGGVRHSVILGFNPNANAFHMKRIPWDNRRRKLQTLGIIKEI